MANIVKSNMIGEVRVMGKKPAPRMIEEVEVKGKKPIKKLDRVLAPKKKEVADSTYKESMVRVRDLKDLRNEYGDFSHDRNIQIEIGQARQGKKLMPASWVKKK
jgi:hypothetical protein